MEHVCCIFGVFQCIGLVLRVWLKGHSQFYYLHQLVDFFRFWLVVDEMLLFDSNSFNLFTPIPSQFNPISNYVTSGTKYIGSIVSYLYANK